MHVLHANWTDGSLHIWAESRESCLRQWESPPEARPAPPVPGEVNDHPFSLDAKETGRMVASLLGLGVEEAAPWSEAHLVVRLPSLDALPLPSDRLGAVVDTGGDSHEPALVAWRIASLRLEPGRVVEVLAALELALLRDDATVSHSVRFWIEVSRFVLDLLEHHRFIPTLMRLHGDELQAAWHPWIHDAHARTLVGRLIESMPPVVRASVDALDGRPWPILESALCVLTDATVRQALMAEEFADALAGRSAQVDPHVRWLSGLLDATSRVEAHQAATELLRDVGKWIQVLEEATEARPLRLAIRVVEPAADPSAAAGVAIASGNPQWTLEFMVAGTTEGAPVLTAEQVWRNPSGAHTALGATQRPEEALVAELARAARICPMLETALSDAKPASLALDTRQAYLFLTEHKEVLEDAGISVVAPPWWGQATARLSARLRIESPELVKGPSSPDGAASEGPSLLGLQALVGYRWQVAVGTRAITIEEFQRMRAQAQGGSALVQLDGQWVEVRAEEIADAQQLLEEQPGGEMTVLEAIQTAHGAAGARRGLPIHGIDATGWVADLLGASTNEKCLTILEQPSGFLGSLRPYQVVGLSWLCFLDQMRLGACLADDMGLGKTIQLIALLQTERERSPGMKFPPTLLIAPTSVISNWQRELSRFSPTLKVAVHHGADRASGDRFVEMASQLDVLITTYALISRDRETITRPVWHRVVLDEAQYIKNPPTKQTSTIRALRATRRIALTGTPVENRLSELWSIMEFCNPGYLGPAPEFRRRFAVPVERQRDAAAAERLRSLVRPFVLRRLKTDPRVINDLPPCVTTKEYATLSSEQAAVYERTVNDMLREVAGAEGMRRRGLVLATLVRLKQICNHPGLVDSGADVSKAGEDHLAAGAVSALAARSGKCSRLLEMLDELHAAGERALIFTQFRRMGHLLSALVRDRLDVEPLFMHGGTTPIKRQQMVDRFQDPRSGTGVFILSLKAGGVGLNLTAASHVFHFDRWWNPAVENQATDRAFRIGQTRTVHVHKFVCMGTLEERVDQMIEQKMELAQNIIGSGEEWLTELTTGQLRDLLTLRPSGVEMEGEDE